MTNKVRVIFTVLFASLMALSLTRCAEPIIDAPVSIISVKTTLNANGTATVVFKTDQPTLGTAEITSDNVNYIYAYKAGARYDTLHSITIFDLKPNTAYYIKARAKMSDGETVTSHSTTVSTGTVSYAPNTFQLHMINIPDPGDCFYIVFPNGKKMLYDAGNSSANSTIITYLQSSGCDTLHYAVATHAHGDHYGSYKWGTLPSVIPIKNFLKPDSYSEDTYSSVISSIQSGYPGAVMHELVRGNTNTNTSVLNIDPATQITVMSAGAYDLEIDDGNSGGSPNSNYNNESLTMKFTYGSARFLMPGDLEQEAYREYIQTNPVTNPVVDVLKASHHLRIDGMNPGILSATNPIIVLASTNSEGGCSGIMQCNALDDVLSFNADLFRIDAVNPHLNRIYREAARDAGHVVVITDGISIQVTKK